MHRFKIFFFTLSGALMCSTFSAVAQQDQLVERGVEIADAEAYAPRPIDTAHTLTTIAFGSCNKLNLPQDIWPAILQNNPNIWIWLGDIIYADTQNPKELAAQYRKLKTLPDYKKLRARTQIIGIYDDHDYGINDGDKNHPTKAAAKKCLLDFLDVPMSAPVRKRGGAYQSYTFGSGPQSVKIILLDTRYFRDELTSDPSKKQRYLNNETGTMLGEEQWAWLAKELHNSRAGLHLLCSSVQIVPSEHPHEKWGFFPNERKRLFALLCETKPQNLMILSGDRHMAEVSKIELSGLPYPLYEFTSSGLTHVRSGDSEVNHFRTGQLHVKRNFGLLKIQWDQDRPTVSMQIRGVKNELLQEITVRY